MERARRFGYDTGQGDAALTEQIVWMPPTAALLIGYLLGSIPFGLILTRVAGAGDLRAIGSGSIGATNVLRTGRKGLAAATLLLDLLKGLIAVVLVARLFPGEEQLAALGALVGHCYPLWLRFRGGKGIATGAGIYLALAWPVALAAALVWIAAFAVSRISSIGGMSAAVAAPVGAALLGRFDLVPLLLVLAVLVLWKHRANIVRLLDGTEPKVGGSKKAPGAGA